MKIISLATKKLNMMFGQEHEQRERIFEETYLMRWYSQLKKSPGLTLVQAKDFCHCCEKFGIKILGFETSYESRYGLNTYAYEEYTDNYHEEWWYNALHDLQLNHITDSIIPYIDIPFEVLNNYIGDEY